MLYLNTLNLIQTNIYPGIYIILIIICLSLKTENEQMRCASYQTQKVQIKFNISKISEYSK